MTCRLALCRRHGLWISGPAGPQTFSELSERYRKTVGVDFHAPRIGRSPYEIRQSAAVGPVELSIDLGEFRGPV
jgi:hypothetical protein